MNVKLLLKNFIFECELNANMHNIDNMELIRAFSKQVIFFVLKRCFASNP